MGILAIGTVRTDRLKKCPLPTDKALMKEGKGSSSYQCDTNSGITVLKWFNNKCVHLCSNHSNPCEISTVERWDKVERKHVKIACPQTQSKEYNKSMGGVDLVDMLISVYCTNIKAKQWYLKVVFHCLDIAKINAWLLYRRHRRHHHLSQGNIQPQCPVIMPGMTMVAIGQSTDQTKTNVDIAKQISAEFTARNAYYVCENILKF